MPPKHKSKALLIQPLAQSPFLTTYLYSHTRLNPLQFKEFKIEIYRKLYNHFPCILSKQSLLPRLLLVPFGIYHTTLESKSSPFFSSKILGWWVSQEVWWNQEWMYPVTIQLQLIITYSYCIRNPFFSYELIRMQPSTSWLTYDAPTRSGGISYGAWHVWKISFNVFFDGYFQDSLCSFVSWAT